MVGHCKKNGWNTFFFFFRLCFLAKVIFNSGSRQICGKSFSTTVDKGMAPGRGPGLRGTLWDEQEGFELMSLPLAAKLLH